MRHRRPSGPPWQDLVFLALLAAFLLGCCALLLYILFDLPQ